MTQLTSDEYVEAGANCCPKCKSGDISGGFIEVEGRTAWQPITCSDCGYAWNDLYELEGYEEAT